MYRNIFTVLFLLASLNIAQSVKVIKTEKLITGDVERLYFPRFSPDGNYIAMTKSNYKGLWLYNLSQKKLTKINDYFGAGYEPNFTRDGKIHFKIDEYKEKRRSPIARVYNILERIESDDTLKSSVNIHVKSGKSNILVFENGEWKKIKPFGEGNYIWVSLSPDKEKILFTFAGKGTYTCDFEGRIISELGYANSPKWSPNGEWITYMNDKDDGLNYTSSDIYVISSNGETKINITNTEAEIEMYPEWSPEGNKIVYQNLSGEVYLTEIEIR